MGKAWQVGTSVYRLDVALLESCGSIVVRRGGSTPFDRAITAGRVQKAEDEFSGNITLEFTQALIGVRGIKTVDIARAEHILDELLTTLNRIVTDRETAIVAPKRESNIAQSRARKAQAHSGFHKDPRLARARH